MQNENNKNDRPVETPALEKEKKPKYKFDKESANLEFEKFCEDWDIDTDLDDLDEEDSDNFNTLKRTLIRKIRTGHLIYDQENETFSYRLLKPMKNAPESKMLKITRTKGESNLVMDNYKTKQSMHKLYAKIGVMIGLPVKSISNMDDVDIKVLTAVQTLFFCS